MRFIDGFYACALIVLLGWLLLGGLMHSEIPSSPRAGEDRTASLPPISASSGQPRSVALATVDQRHFRIFVAGSPDVWSVAVSEDD